MDDAGMDIDKGRAELRDALEALWGRWGPSFAAGYLGAELESVAARLGPAYLAELTGRVSRRALAGGILPENMNRAD